MKQQKSLARGIVRAINEKNQKVWKSSLMAIALAGTLSFTGLAYASSSTETGYSTLGSNNPTAALDEALVPFQVEMFPGEHLRIPGKVIAARIDYFNDSALLAGVALQNMSVTVTVPDSSYFNAAESGLFVDGTLEQNSGIGWACDDNGAEGDRCHFAIDSLASGQSGSLRFAATMYPNSGEFTEISDEVISIEARLSADNMPASAVALFQNDIVIGTSAPTSLMPTQEEPIDGSDPTALDVTTEPTQEDPIDGSDPTALDVTTEPVQDFQIFLPMVISW